jgi:uncharacterized protein (AIM24 family)
MAKNHAAMMRLSESKRERALILPSESIFAVFDGKGTAILQTVQYSKVGHFLCGMIQAAS